ncbi:nmrA-like family protein [Aspergillus bombycis]|uniref:NmrA-like family protein n=1 Tax=Aspergillus bombycis TaxID=109264 RepID=A0A1F8AHD5_9EURO|nr:nmrA-like family protein [Aspergillus bombycis]OGM51146.1 nmrA-like family protein [Aspergillus bombycis]
MVIVAVAGGTGGVGRTIVEALVQQAKHQVILLTRGVPKSDPLLDQIQQVQVGYNDSTALARTLDQHGVHTVISAIGIVSDETSQSQLTLINAAAQSSATKRFIPSEYSFIQTEEYTPQEYLPFLRLANNHSLLSIDPSIKYWLAAAELLKTTTLKFTRVIPGFFMDYWGMPVVHTNLQPFTFGIDIASCQAAIPGDGNDVICMTYTYDMAVFIVRLLDAEDWPEFSVIVGSQTTYNQLLQLAEELRGKKFQVVYDSADRIKEGDVTIPPMPADTGYSAEELKETTALVSRLTIAGVFDLPRENRLNARFPDIETTKLEYFLSKAWGSYQ